MLHSARAVTRLSLDASLPRQVAVLKLCSCSAATWDAVDRLERMVALAVRFFIAWTLKRSVFVMLPRAAFSHLRYRGATHDDRHEVTNMES